MKHLFYTLYAVLLLFSFMTGCRKEAPNAVSLQVEFTWTSAHKCSSVSPEIRVAGIPATTKRLDIRMTDLDYVVFDHGGGTVKYEGSDVIPTGALKRYQGPCPPAEPHRYSIEVEAIDASDVIVGSGRKTQSCCP